MSVQTVLGKNVQDWTVHWKGYTLGPGPQGRVWFVDSSNGNAADSQYQGQDPDYPFNTLNYAFQVLQLESAPARTNLGDVIVVGAGHTETIDSAGDLDCDVAGVTVLGQGVGTNRPTFNFATDTAADCDIDAANITIYNCIFQMGIASQVIMFDVNAAAFRLLNCRVEENSATAISCVDLAGAGAGCVIDGLEFYSTTAGNLDEAIHINSTVDRLTIKDCYIIGDFDDAAIHNPTGNVATNLLIQNCIVANAQTTDHAIELVSATTGVITDCRLYGDTSGSILDPGSCRVFNTLESAAIDTAAIPSPLSTTDAANNILGADNSNNAFASTNVAQNADGSIIERLEYIQQAAVTPNGAFQSSLGTRVVATSGDVTAAADDIFTVTGKVLVTLIHGEVTTTIAGGTTPTVKLNTKTANADICAATTVTADASGTLYMISGDQDDTANQGDAPEISLGQLGDANAHLPIIVNGDTIEMTTTGTATAGVITWELYYHPLEASATVAASA